LDNIASSPDKGLFLPSYNITQFGDIYFKTTI